MQHVTPGSNSSSVSSSSTSSSEEEQDEPLDYRDYTWTKYGSLDGTEAILLRFARSLYLPNRANRTDSSSNNNNNKGNSDSDDANDLTAIVLFNTRDREELMNHATTAMLTAVLHTVTCWPGADTDLFDQFP
jgi:hypothetical protein